VRFIEEIVVDRFLPTVRSMLATELRDRGFTQREVADALGVSQSAVSKYLHGGVAREERIATDDRVREAVERVAEGLATGDTSRVAALVELEVLIRRLETDGVLAELHAEAVPELREADAPFAVHDPESPLRERERVLASVRRGLGILTSASGFASLIPNVGSNVAECLADADGIADVAAVPGRLVDVKGRATVPGEPEFGVSGHVASVLLAARAAGADVRGAVNVRYDPALVDRLAADHPTVEFDADGDAPGAVRRALSGRSPGETVVVYQTGGVGIEPVVYVLAADAPAAARIVRDLLSGEGGR